MVLERRITAALAVETFRLSPAQALSLDTRNADSTISHVVTNHLHGSFDAAIQLLPLRPYGRIFGFHAPR